MEAVYQKMKDEVYKIKSAELRWTPVHVASVTGNQVVLKYLYSNWQEKTVNPFTQRDAQGFTSLHLAAKSGNEEAFKFILRELPELMTKLTKNRQKLLHILAKEGNTNLLEAFKWNIKQNIPYAKDSYAKDSYDNTPAHYAAANCQLEFLEKLIEVYPDNIDINAQNKEGGHSPSPSPQECYRGESRAVEGAYSLPVSATGNRSRNPKY